MELARMHAVIGVLASALSVQCFKLPPSAKGRGTFLHGALAAGLSMPANAFDLPPLDAFEDPKQRAEFAAKPNPSSGKQASCAFYAVTIGDVPSLQNMVKSGWDLDKATDTAGKTTLHRAAQVGSAAAVQVLLDAGVTIDAKTRWDETPLHMAVRNGRLGVVKQLVAAGASTSIKTYGGDTAFSLASKYRMTAVSDFLSTQ
mmetsp:Transcript_21538/g.35543  ORF Transcript_21538/g.35543 Transcript_21538/m.35543 type:complete len:201 (-) Transcript_21538:432-1034(-)